MQHLSVVTLLSFSFSRRESQLFREKKLCTLFSCKESPLFFLKVTFHSFLVKNLHFPRHCPLCWPLLCQLLKQAILEATQSAGNGHAHRQQEHFNLFYISFQHFLNFSFFSIFPSSFLFLEGSQWAGTGRGLKTTRYWQNFSPKVLRNILFMNRSDMRPVMNIHDFIIKETSYGHHPIPFGGVYYISLHHRLRPIKCLASPAAQR